MNRMEKMQKYSIIWGIMVVIIVALLTLLGFMYKDKTKVYKDLEKKLVEAEKKYVDAKFLYPQSGETLKTSHEELINERYLDNLKLEDKECSGYVEVYLDGTVYNYKGYVKCDNYETKGYEE